MEDAAASTFRVAGSSDAVVHAWTITRCHWELCLLGCYTVSGQVVLGILTHWSTFHMSGTTCLTKQHHIPADFNLQQHRCQNLKPCNYLTTLITSLSNLICGNRVFLNSIVPHICITDPTITPPLFSLQRQRNDNWIIRQSFLNTTGLFFGVLFSTWKMR